MLHGLYLSELLEYKRTPHSLRSEIKKELKEPKTCTTYGDRAFSVEAPKLWNKLPDHIRSTTEINIFKSKLKTHLFESF